MLSEPPCRFGHNKTASLLVLIAKVLKMKTYTLTWKPRIRIGLCAKKLCRCRFDFFSPAYPFSICIGLTKKDALRLNPIFAFMYMCCFADAPNSLRLSSCGRLVARSATYQGI